jgi:Tol biopolymer transport system component
MKIIPIVALLLAYAVSSYSQEAIGLNPPGMRWRQIETPAGRIIFPSGLDSLAFRTAALVNYQRVHDFTIASDDVTQRVSHIIQNQSTLPAGFSTPAPWRNEYYITPPANMFLGPLAWTDALELHEYRHAQQFSMANQGLTLPYKIVLGQTGWLLNTLITQPLWFREGDAVLAETIFTKGGRGRLPSFHMEYRAIRLAGYHYDYEKAHFNSLRDFVPNPYRIGYYMVTKARRDFGNDSWNKVLVDTYTKKGFFYPFSRSLQKFTDYTTKEFYNKTVSELDSLWTSEDKKLQLTQTRLVSKPNTRKYTNYRFPQFVSNESWVVQKSALDQIATYYLLTQDGKEKKLFSPGRYSDDHVTLVAENGKMVWAESGFHERYINKDYSIIKLHDLKSGRTRKLTSKTRYFSPSLSKDGEKIFVTETDLQNRYYHLLLDADDGAILSRRPNSDGVFLSHPRWVNDQIHVICVAVSEKGNALVRLNTTTSDMDVLIPFTATPISRPYPTSDYIYFSAGFSSVNNIYAFQLSTQKIFQVTTVRFGAFEPVVSADEKRLAFSEYTPDGYRTMEMNINPSEWSEVQQRGANKADFFLSGLENNEERDLTDTVAAPVAHEVKKFNALTSGLFNFYGWLVLPNSPEYGAEFYTQNIMSTLRGTVGALYNTNENRFHYYARATYAAFYPILEVEYNVGNRHTALVSTDDPTVEPFDQPWREDVLSGGIRLPFRLTQGTHNTTLSLEGRYEQFNVSFLDTADTKNSFTETDFNALRSEFRFSRTKMQAPQQFNPQWGQVLEAEYREATDGQARRVSASALLYFPGLFRTHSLNLRGSYKEEKVVNAYRFTDDFVMPRGYRPYPFEEIAVASANYQVPVLYPDFALGSVAFVQRLRCNVFYDYGRGILNDRTITMRSPGTELYVDLRVFRLFQMSACFRYTFVEESASPAPEIMPFQFIVTRFELLN